MAVSAIFGLAVDVATSDHDTLRAMRRAHGMTLALETFQYTTDLDSRSCEREAAKDEALVETTDTQIVDFVLVS
jgi:hypothetical protein